MSLWWICYTKYRCFIVKLSIDIQNGLYIECHNVEFPYAECHNAECRLLNIFLLNVIMYNVIMLNVIMLNSIMLNSNMLNSIMPKLLSKSIKCRTRFFCFPFVVQTLSAFSLPSGTFRRLVFPEWGYLVLEKSQLPVGKREKHNFQLFQAFS